MIRTITGYGFAAGLLAALAACAPAFYPAYPIYYAPPAHPSASRHPPNQTATSVPPPQSSGEWVNPEPVR